MNGNVYVVCFFGLSSTSTTSGKSNSSWNEKHHGWLTNGIVLRIYLRIMNLIWILFDHAIQLKVPSILNDVQITIYLLSFWDFRLWVPLRFLALHSERKVSFIKEMQKVGKQRTNCEWDSWFSQSMVITHNCRSKSIVNQCHLLTLLK